MYQDLSYIHKFSVAKEIHESSNTNSPETFMKIETGEKTPCTVLCNVILFANECISLGVIGFFLHHNCFKSFLQTWKKGMPQCIPKPLTSRNEKTLAEKFSASESVFSSRHYWEIPLQKHQGQRKNTLRKWSVSAAFQCVFYPFSNPLKALSEGWLGVASGKCANHFHGQRDGGGWLKLRLDRWLYFYYCFPQGKAVNKRAL